MHLRLIIHCWNQDNKRERAVAYLGCQEYRTLVHENRYQPNDGETGQIFTWPKEEKILTASMTVNSRTIDSTNSYSGEKIRKPGPQNIFCGLRWTAVVLHEVGTNFALLFSSLPQPKINPRGQEKKRKKPEFYGGYSPTQPPPYSEHSEHIDGSIVSTLIAP